MVLHATASPPSPPSLELSSGKSGYFSRANNATFLRADQRASHMLGPPEVARSEPVGSSSIRSDRDCAGWGEVGVFQGLQSSVCRK